MLDALKTFQAEGWRLLELQTLKELAHCYRLLAEKEKLVRVLLQIASFREEDSTQRHEMFDQAMKIASDLGESVRVMTILTSNMSLLRLLETFLPHSSPPPPPPPGVRGARP